MLECVINISEGRGGALINQLGDASGRSLLDVHADPHHHRSVFTLAGDDVLRDAITLTTTALELLDLRDHRGAHPRIGIVDVVPFVPLGDAGLRRPPQLTEALVARDEFADYVSETFALPCFFYGPERSLPEVRRSAFTSLAPDRGPSLPHPSAGAVCVGARGMLVAYNINVVGLSAATTKQIATAVRSDAIRALGLVLDGEMQISCNLVDPLSVGIAEAYDQVAALVHQAGGGVRGAELVGLIPERLLRATSEERWAELALGESATIESKLSRRGALGARPQHS